MLYDNNQRYYPSKRGGQLDEWGAVIKHQTEQFEFEQQKLKAEEQARKHQYFEQLRNDIELRRQAKDLDRQQRVGEA